MHQHGLTAYGQELFGEVGAHAQPLSTGNDNNEVHFEN
jgi:hypothetical protein